MGTAQRSPRDLRDAISEATRETDITGWYENGAILAVIFTEINLDGKNPIAEVLRSKVVAALQDNLDHKLASKLVVTFHFFPQSWDKDRPDRVADVKLYPEISQRRIQETSSDGREAGDGRRRCQLAAACVFAAAGCNRSGHQAYAPEVLSYSNRSGWGSSVRSSSA